MILIQMLRYITGNTWSVVQSGRNQNLFRLVHIDTHDDGTPVYIECTKTQDSRVIVSVPLSRRTRFHLFFACEQQAYEYLEYYILDMDQENSENIIYPLLSNDVSKKRKRGQHTPIYPYRLQNYRQ